MVQRIRRDERQGNKDPEVHENHFGEDEGGQSQTQQETVRHASPVRHAKHEESRDDEKRSGMRLGVEAVGAYQELAVLSREQERSGREPGTAGESVNE